MRNYFLLMILVIFLGCTHQQKLTQKEQKHIELLSESCFQNNAEKCHQLGTFYRNRRLKEKKYLVLAKRFYQKSCSLNYSESCYQAASLFSLENRNKKSIEKTRILYQKGCNLKHHMSCLKLGYHYKHDSSQYQKDAIKYFKKSCSFGNKEGCSNIHQTKRERGKDEINDDFTGFLGSGFSMIDQTLGFAIGGGFIYEDLSDPGLWFTFQGNIKLLPIEDQVIWIPHLEVHIFNFGLGVSAKISDEISKPIVNSYLSLPLFLYGSDFKLFGKKILPKATAYWRCYWEKGYGFFNEIGIMIDFYKFFVIREY